MQSLYLSEPQFSSCKMGIINSSYLIALRRDRVFTDDCHHYYYCYVAKDSWSSICGIKSLRAKMGCPRPYSESGMDPRFPDFSFGQPSDPMQTTSSPNDLKIWVSDRAKYHSWWFNKQSPCARNHAGYMKALKHPQISIGRSFTFLRQAKT